MNPTEDITGYRYLQVKKYQKIRLPKFREPLLFHFEFFKAYFVPSARLFVAAVIAACGVTTVPLASILR